MKDLIIVESPTKAKTIQNFLGDKYEVIASKGHIRDLPDFRLGIKVENGHFTPQYEIDKDHKAIVGKITELSKKANITYIATDEDREGEAIGYHITQALKKDVSSFPRIVFHEITKTAINNALNNPKKIDMDKVNAQQARRLLDRIVGYKLSNLIASKIQRGLSAGRVQSAALKILVDREREINAFVPVVYFVVDGIFDKNIESTLIEYKNTKIEKLTLQDEKQADEIVATLKKENFIVEQISKKSKNTSTPPPFMTSTLQQSASTMLGFSPKKTMSVAQKLYEGVPTNEGVMGVITYMRTDSLNIAKEASISAREHIGKTYGDAYVPEKPKFYTSKSKGAQEAHEAIRPSNVAYTPSIAKGYISGDELKLYTLIYNRFLASQSVDAKIESQSIIFVSPSGKFKANGNKILFDGFYKILGRGEDKDKILPDLKENQNVQTQSITSTQKQTEPPARYNEASLIKTLESLGIGRPSTYAPTLSLLQSREYISIEKKAIKALDSSFKVIGLLEEHFSDIVDSDFSASLENKLDDIAYSKADWEAVLWEFYEPFMEKIEQGKTNIVSQKISEPTGEMCPECGKELVKRNGRYGEFVACSGYPKCKYVKKDEKSTNDESTGEICEKCGKEMVKKIGRKGAFIACSGYPKCKNTKNISGEKSATPSIDVKCPDCGKELVQRFGRMGAFYGCSGYPKCKFISKYLPNGEKCDECGGAMIERTLRGKDIKECLKCKKKISID